MGTNAQEIARIQNAKAAIAQSIENKGVTVPSGTKIDGMAALIDSISTGGTTSPWVFTTYIDPSVGGITYSYVFRVGVLATITIGSYTGQQVTAIGYNYDGSTTEITVNDERGDYRFTPPTGTQYIELTFSSK